MQATLSKWGNSKGLRVPAQAVEELDLVVGARADITIDSSRRSITYTFEEPSSGYARSRRMTLEEFANGWDGDKVGEEWAGTDVGAEVIEE